MFYGKFTLLGDGVLVNDTSDLEYAIQLGIDRKLQEFILAAMAIRRQYLKVLLVIFVLNPLVLCLGRRDCIRDCLFSFMLPCKKESEAGF